jgi:hypothetical protein
LSATGVHTGQTSQWPVIRPEREPLGLHSKTVLAPLTPWLRSRHRPRLPILAFKAQLGTCVCLLEPTALLFTAMAWPCAGPSRSVRRISRSSVPCSSSVRSRYSLVDILGECNAAQVECQRESSRQSLEHLLSLDSDIGSKRHRDFDRCLVESRSVRGSREHYLPSSGGRPCDEEISCPVTWEK